MSSSVVAGNVEKYGTVDANVVLSSILVVVVIISDQSDVEEKLLVAAVVDNVEKVLLASVEVVVLEKAVEVVFSTFKAGGNVTAMIVQSTTNVTLPATTQPRLFEFFTS